MTRLSANGADADEYEVFLQSWTPRGRLRHALLPQNINDPLSTKRLLDDGDGSAPVERVQYTQGKKTMASDEEIVRHYAFFQDHQKKWSEHFRDYVLSKAVPEEKFNTFVESFARSWVDGSSRRQGSPEMLAIKASVRQYDLLCHSATAGRFVIRDVDQSLEPLFTPSEMAVIFEANLGLTHSFLSEYLEKLYPEGPSALDELYVRRGVYMTKVEKVRRELNYLSSYSLAMGPVEQFAQTWTPETRGTGEPSIFSAPLPAVQNRIVAFAPFISDMDLCQLELVVAPPVEEMKLHDDGEHGGIYEFHFD